MIGAVDAVDQAIRDVDRLITTGYQGQLARVLREAETALAKRLAGIVRRNGGKLHDAFTPAQLEAFREQIGLLAAYTQQRLEGLTDEQARVVIDKSIATTVDVMGRLEGRFQGAARPVDIQSATRMSAIAGRTDASLLRDRKRSWERYGGAMVGDFERSMRIGLSQGRSNAEMISGLITVAPKDIAQQLHDAEPRYFPDPKAGFVARQYWAERIVRTEMANASNEANQQTMKDSQRQFPDLKRKILAVGDRRTAEDSLLVHGQVRGMNEHFVDGAGRSYLRPPARPNDRETIIPWRDSWEETSVTRQHTPAEISELEARAEKFRESQKKPAKKPKPVKPSKVKPAKPPKAAKLPPAPKPGPPLAKPAKIKPPQAPKLPKEQRSEWQEKRLLRAGYAPAEAKLAAHGHAMVERGRALTVGDVDRELQQLQGWRPPIAVGSIAHDTKIGSLSSQLRGQELRVAQLEHAAALVAHRRELGAAAPPIAQQLSSMALTTPGDKRTEARACVTEAQSFYASLAGSRCLVVDGLKGEFSATRANFSALNNTVRFNSASSLIHEVGHAIDERSQRSDRASTIEAGRSFIERRAKGRPLQPLQSLLPSRSFRADEEAYPDEFRNAYIGKRYLSPTTGTSWYATEVFSMGVESLHSEGARMLREDPEHYALILGWLGRR